MKKMMSVIVAGFAGMAFATAYEANTNAQVVGAEQIMVEELVAQDSVKRTLVESSDLPTAVQETLRGDDYMGWTVATAYLVEPEGQDAYYEISLQREGEEDLRIVLLNADGTVRESAE